MKKGNKYGVHRVIEPKGVMPQPAWKIDHKMEIYDNEILIDVQTLNIDSASFTQIKDETGGDQTKIKARMQEIVAERGKHHNPVTGSGGMLIGTVEQIGPALAARDLKVGDRIATLVSLSLTPLRIDRIKEVRKEIDQVDIEGKAILFESGIYAKLPDDMEDTLALAVLDVAGAAAQTARLVKPGDTVLIIGAGGKSGLLCLHEAKKRAGVTGKVIAMGHSDRSCQRARELGLADVVIQGDATKPIEVLEMIEEVTAGELVDLVINNVNIPDTEMASILATKDGGKIYFFSMATSFTKAALGAEGVGKDVEMIVGNGYARGHADISLEILRENELLREIFTRLYT
ncbi:MAG: medium chain dehydrogenase/reductase family protein [Halanaerobiales bacterium]|nr:medium chain dehydrogenase/reductase family protein [Halanaerobiales bacterium]